MCNYIEIALPKRLAMMGVVVPGKNSTFSQEYLMINSYGRLLRNLLIALIV